MGRKDFLNTHPIERNPAPGRGRPRRVAGVGGARRARRPRAPDAPPRPYRRVSIAAPCRAGNRRIILTPVQAPGLDPEPILQEHNGIVFLYEAKIEVSSIAHHYSNSLYDRLADRLNQFPQGAPLSKSLFEILKILFTEKEAGLVAQLPIKPFTVDRAAEIWKLDKATTRNMLEDLAGRAMLLDIEQNGEQTFCLPPPMAGFFEFSMMRVRGDFVNQKALAELYYQYLNVEEDFVKSLFVENGTPLGRIFVQEAALPQDGKLEVLDYERASHIIPHGLAHRRQHVLLPPQDAASGPGLRRAHGHLHDLQHLGALAHQVRARPADGRRRMSRSARRGAGAQSGPVRGKHPRGRELHLQLLRLLLRGAAAVKQFAIARTIHSNFIAHADDGCRGCGKCEKVCPVNAVSMREGPAGKRFAFIDPERCIGCGVCVRSCAFAQIRQRPAPNAPSR